MSLETFSITPTSMKTNQINHPIASLKTSNRTVSGLVLTVLLMLLAIGGSTLTSCKTGKPTYSRAPAQYNKTVLPFHARMRRFAYQSTPTGQSKPAAAMAKQIVSLGTAAQDYTPSSY
jgi:hypothetical protein